MLYNISPRKRYEIVCTEDYLDIGLCVERDKDLKPTRVLARLFPHSTLSSYGAPEYGAVENLKWINTRKFMSIEKWRKVSYNKSTEQILNELGIKKRKRLLTKPKIENKHIDLVRVAESDNFVIEYDKVGKMYRVSFSEDEHLEHTIWFNAYEEESEI